MSKQQGYLFIIGGGEDRSDVKTVLRRFVELCGGPGSSVVILPSASSTPQKMWEVYDEALDELGVKRRCPVFVKSREEADDPAFVSKVTEADSIFMAGGDQTRLLDALGGTLVHSAMLVA